MGLIEELYSSEIIELKKEYHDIMGVWLGYHWECFANIDDYKGFMKEAIRLYKKTLEDTQSEEKARDAVEEFGRKHLHEHLKNTHRI